MYQCSSVARLHVEKQIVRQRKLFLNGNCHLYIFVQILESLFKYCMDTFDKIIWLFQCFQHGNIKYYEAQIEFIVAKYCEKGI